MSIRKIQYNAVKQKLGECEVTVRENNLNIVYPFKTRKAAVKFVKNRLKNGWIDNIRVLQCCARDCDCVPVWIDITNDIEQVELEDHETGCGGWAVRPMIVEYMTIDDRVADTVTCKGSY